MPALRSHCCARWRLWKLRGTAMSKFDDAVAEFLRRGGNIQEVPAGVSAPDESITRMMRAPSPKHGPGFYTTPDIAGHASCAVRAIFGRR